MAFRDFLTWNCSSRFHGMPFRATIREWVVCPNLTKTMKPRFSIEAPPGFQGLDPYRPVYTYTRNLPHWRQEGATYFVTFRLADALPQVKLDELKLIKEKWEREIESKQTREEKKAAWEAYARTAFEKSERWLDRGYGRCLLQSETVQRLAGKVLTFFDGTKYELGSYVVMPNHIHLIVRPFAGNELEQILQSRKRKLSREINELSRRRGQLWQEESHDRIVRDSEHLWRCIQYVGKNPKKARLSPSKTRRWIRPDWRALGWDFQKAEAT